jgi:hypothetical protein
VIASHSCIVQLTEDLIMDVTVRNGELVVMSRRVAGRPGELVRQTESVLPEETLGQALRKAALLLTAT